MLNANLENVRAAAEIIKRGGLVVYPTDTVYGLGCDPFNIDAVARLLQVKGARDKPLPVLSYGFDDIEKVAELSDKARRIGEKFWPGPLTLILQKRLHSDIVTFGLATVGVRVPNHKVALELTRLSGGLLVGTSANKTGARPPFTADEAYKQLKNQVDVILDGGVAELRASSTVLDLTGERPKILRTGPITLKNLAEFGFI